MVTKAQLKTISKSKTQKAALVDGLVVALEGYKPHVQAHILAQVMHESGGLVFDREVWGPTAAQSRYDGRKDLGNTKKGDGSKYRGYGPIQITGRRNVTAFYSWAKAKKMSPPDFIDKPELIATAPWAGWSVVWYWEEGSPSKAPLTRYADSNDIEMITRRVNGGLNGYEDRLSYYDRAALVLLGYKVNDIEAFQKSARLFVDGVSGPQTRAAMHRKLVALTEGEAERKSVRASPVVETETVVETKTEAVPVTPPSIDAPWYKSKEVIVPLITGGGLSSVGGVMDRFGGMPTANLAILLVFGFVIIAAALYALKRKDQKIVAAQVDAVNASNTVA